MREIDDVRKEHEARERYRAELRAATRAELEER
jgi:hypothetical protein